MAANELDAAFQLGDEIVCQMRGRDRAAAAPLDLVDSMITSPAPPAANLPAFIRDASRWHNP